MAVCIALLAHPGREEELLRWAASHRDALAARRLLAPQDLVPRMIQEAGFTAEAIESLPSPQDGGDIEVAARALDGQLAAILCFTDPLAPPGTVPDLRLLLRVSQLRSIPLALDAATAELALRGLTRSRRAWLIFNPVAGQGNPDQELALIRTSLEPQILLHVVMTRPDRDPADQTAEIVATILAGTAAHEGHGATDPEGPPEPADSRLILASGGDGTVSAVAGALIGSGIPLGVIPRGTANAFSVALGIPTDIRGACDTILAGHARVLDAARCNDVPMVLLAGIGFEAGMVDRASREMKNMLGPLAYVLAGAQQFADQDIFTARLEIDGQTSELQAAAITVANVAPATSVMAQGFGTVIPDDGQLEITIATSPTRMQGLSAMASLFTSAVVHSPTEREDLLCLRGRSIRIETDPPQKLVIDGELLEANPIRIECHPDSLQVLTPMTSS